MPWPIPRPLRSPCLAPHRARANPALQTRLAAAGKSDGAETNPLAGQVAPLQEELDEHDGGSPGINKQDQETWLRWTQIQIPLSPYQFPEILIHFN